jgi:GTPase SAR1 family protein|uniref:G domain-containing protein n=1 Tax=Panagrolaimus sp. PS1159 TaxID=55785 RepID=A0AC35GTK3_9BILA
MHNNKNDRDEPMEVDDKNNSSTRSKRDNDNDQLMTEAVFFADLLNSKLRSLTKEDAERFMEKFENSVVLLPKNQKNNHNSSIPHMDKPEVPPHALMQHHNLPTKDDKSDVVKNEETAVNNTVFTYRQNYEQPKSYHEQKYSSFNIAPSNDVNPCNQPEVNYDFKRQDSAPNNTYDYINRTLENKAEYIGTHNPVYNTDSSTDRKLIPAKGMSYSVDIAAGIKLVDTPPISPLLNQYGKDEKANRTKNNEHYNSSSQYSTRRGASNAAALNVENKTQKNGDKLFRQDNSNLFCTKNVTEASLNLSSQLLSPAVQTPVANYSEQNNEWLQSSFIRNNQKLKENKKAINILILGQTGVGKSTWINAFANYLMYNTLEEAIEAKAPICVIPTKFSMCDESYRRHEILLGNHSNEVFSDKGQSATQNAKTYLFEKDDQDIYIIDTPGMDDTRGCEQDNENIQKILRVIAPFKELHAICFLFKANEPRLSQSFRYSISKLLGNLSKSALDNACFVFTNARGTFYKPGDTMVPLKAYFKQLHEKEGLVVNINEKNTFCLDNEAFRFICAYFSSIKFDQHEMKTYGDSWKHSSKEISRLLQYASRLRPHTISETLSINETRTWILQLVNPTINVSEIIQANLQRLDERIQDLELTKNNIQELQRQANIPLVSIDVIPLENPQTVCTSSKCADYKIIDGRGQMFFNTICHKPCHLPLTDPYKREDEHLKNCAAFKGSWCTECKCHIKEHRRLLYEKRIVTKYLESKIAKNAITSQEDAAATKKLLISNCLQMSSDYRAELEFLMNAMAKFSLFLEQNGISYKFDMFEKHIENSLANEKNMLSIMPQYNDKNYKQLEDILIKYRTVRNSHSKNRTISIVEIQDLRLKLFTLPLTGPKITELFGINVEVDKHDYAENITLCDKKSVIKRSMDWIKNCFSSYLGY